METQPYRTVPVRLWVVPSQSVRPGPPIAESIFGRAILPQSGRPVGTGAGPAAIAAASARTAHDLQGVALIHPKEPLHLLVSELT